MKIIDLVQGSEEWLKWRKSVITATECPCILGISPYATPYKAWQLKLGLIAPGPVNDAMLRGQRLEPEARVKFTQEYDIEMTPACVESSQYNFLGASLDGLSSCLKYLLEIKCNGEKTHHNVLNGQIPSYHIAQMQHQLLVTGAEKCFYYSYDGDKGHCIEVFPDHLFWENFIKKAKDWWHCISEFEPPEFSDKDYRNMSNDKYWQTCAMTYQDLDQEIKTLEQKKDFVRRELIRLCANQSSEGFGVKVLKTIVSGRIDYEIIPELQKIDLNKYRKEPSESWRVFLNHKDES